MSISTYQTANSKTLVEYDDDWLVLDIGSGHNPHQRANVIVDRYLFDDDDVAGRSGREVKIPEGTLFVLADGNALPFRDKTFDFAICSHVLEHVESLDTFCSELNRVASAGYIETPSKLAELLRHAHYHIWFVSCKKDNLLFEPAPYGYPLGWFGKLFFSLYFYNSPQLEGKDVYAFARGVKQPWHRGLSVLRDNMRKVWIRSKPLTYTRLKWNDSFSWHIKASSWFSN